MKPSQPTVRQITDPDAVSRYTDDESSAFHGEASAVYLPGTTREVEEVVRIAAKTGAELTLSGAGTSITGARVPEGGIVLATERLRDIRTIEGIPEDTDAWSEVREPDACIRLCEEGSLALVPAGIRLSELDQLLEPRDLLYPPDPTEMTAMAGGTIATNASGARSYRYGATRKWVEALLVVTSTGTAVWVGRGDHLARDGVIELPRGFPQRSVAVPSLALPQTKNAAGLRLAPEVDLVDLIVGSEGILAVVVAALVRLVPRPQPLMQIAGFFDSPLDALRCADDARGDADVLAIEYFDRCALDFIRHEYPLTPDAAACVMFELTYPCAEAPGPHPPEGVLERWISRLGASSSTGDWAAAGEQLETMKAFRHALPEQVNRWVGQRVGKLGTDMAVPAAAFAQMWRRYEEVRSVGIASVLFGHLGEYHLHLNFLPENEEELARARELYRDLARTAVELGGTISAEHGVGKKKLTDETGLPHPYLWFMYGEDGLRTVQRIKAAFDPNWMLNPQTMVPRP